MRYDWFKKFSINQSINLSQFFDSVEFWSGSGWRYHLVIDFCIVMFYMLMIFMKFSFVPQTFVRIFYFRIRIRIMTRMRISPWNSFEKVILYILKIPKKLDTHTHARARRTPAKNHISRCFLSTLTLISRISFPKNIASLVRKWKEIT